ncbi:MAG: glycosyltransferase [Acidimicrobiales bacterium]|nr:glycosyltransferase [Acidimicrobiales bacterium]
MTPVGVQFLVNAGPGSAAGERAERIARMVDGDAIVTYRKGTRRADAVAMAREVARNAPEVVYAMDLAVAPVAAWALDGGRRRLIVDTGDAPLAFLELIGASATRRAMARALESVGYGRSDLVIVRGRYHAEQLHAAGHHHVSVVADGVDLDLLQPKEVTDLRTQLGLDRRMTVGVQGNFTWYPKLGGGLGWDLVQAIGRHDLDIDAVFIGEGPGLAQLRLMAERLGVGDRVHMMGRVAYSQLATYLSLCDVTLLTQTDDPSSWARTTGKLPTYLATGRYVVATRVGTAVDLLEPEHLLDYRGHWDTTYPDRLARKLGELAHDRDRTIARGLALRSLAESFDYDRIARSCASEIARVCERSAGSPARLTLGAGL